MDSTIILGFVTFLPCLIHLSLVRITIMIAMLYMLYRKSLSILTPYGANDFCASDTWSFVESTLLKVKAYEISYSSNPFSVFGAQKAFSSY